MRKRMLETQYRASRICRVLSDPTAYQIIKILIDTKKKPREIAQDLGISLMLTSATLRILRNVDLLRYEIKGQEKIYWIKDKTIPKICFVLEKFVSRTRNKTW